MKLLDLFIEFSTKGVDGLKAEIDKQKGAADTLKSSYEQLGATAKTAFAAASASIMGFVTAGFAGTAEGNLFAESMKQFSEEIASLFIPVMQTATDLIRGATEWFRSLSSAQQDSIANFILIVGAIGTGIIFFSKMITLTLSLATAVKGLAVAFGILNLSTGGILLAIGALVTVVALLAAGIAGVFSEGEKGKSKDHRGVQRTQGGKEDLLATYSRIQQGALKMDVGRRQTELLEQIEKNTHQTNREVRDKPPAVGA